MTEAAITTVATHWHVGFGLAGYGPEGENVDFCDTVLDAAQVASSRLVEAADSAFQDADLLGDQEDYEGAWKTFKLSEDLRIKAANLDVEKRFSAPLFQGDPTAMQRSIEPLLAEAPFDVSDNTRLYVWECTESECEAAPE